MFRSKEPVAWDPRYFDSTIRVCPARAGMIRPAALAFRFTGSCPACAGVILPDSRPSPVPLQLSRMRGGDSDNSMSIRGILLRQPAMPKL